jgi:hypothetical protein
MFKFISITLLCLGLVACSPMASQNGLAGLPPAPVVLADQTILDEQASLSVELAYQASALTLRTAFRAGLLKGDAAARAAAADNTAYAAVQAVRAAYDAGNATSYATSLLKARTAVTNALTLLKGETP